MLALLLLLFYLLRGVSLYLSLLTPVWGAVVQPEWMVVRGSKPVALVTLAIPGPCSASLAVSSATCVSAATALLSAWRSDSRSSSQCAKTLTFASRSFLRDSELFLWFKHSS